MQETSKTCIIVTNTILYIQKLIYHIVSKIFIFSREPSQIKKIQYYKKYVTVRSHQMTNGQDDRFSTYRLDPSLCEGSSENMKILLTQVTSKTYISDFRKSFSLSGGALCLSSSTSMKRLKISANGGKWKWRLRWSYLYIDAIMKYLKLWSLMMFNDMYASMHSATFDNKYDHFHGDDMMMMMINNFNDHHWWWLTMHV